MADTPKNTFSRRGFLKGAGVTAATTVIESANALAREAKDASPPTGHWGQTLSPSNCTSTGMSIPSPSSLATPSPKLYATTSA